MTELSQEVFFQGEGVIISLESFTCLRFLMVFCKFEKLQLKVVMLLLGRSKRVSSLCFTMYSLLLWFSVL